MTSVEDKLDKILVEIQILHNKVDKMNESVNRMDDHIDLVESTMNSIMKPWNLLKIPSPSTKLLK